MKGYEQEYKVMDVYETNALTVVPVGEVYVDGGRDLACTITDCKGNEIAYKEFDECVSGIDVTEWARGNGFKMTDRCADFAEETIYRAFCIEEGTLSDVVSHLVSTFPEYERAQFIDAKGKSREYGDAVKQMDKELRKELISKIGPCYPQDFIEHYAKFHEERFGEPFAPFAGGAW